MPKSLQDLAYRFLVPENGTCRLREALMACFFDGQGIAPVNWRFGCATVNLHVWRAASINQTDRPIFFPGHSGRRALQTGLPSAWQPHARAPLPLNANPFKPTAKNQG